KIADLIWRVVAVRARVEIECDQATAVARDRRAQVLRARSGQPLTSAGGGAVGVQEEEVAGVVVGVQQIRAARPGGLRYQRDGSAVSAGASPNAASNRPA